MFLSKTVQYFLILQRKAFDILAERSSNVKSIKKVMATNLLFTVFKNRAHIMQKKATEKLSKNRKKEDEGLKDKIKPVKAKALRSAAKKNNSEKTGFVDNEEKINRFRKFLSRIEDQYKQSAFSVLVNSTYCMENNVAKARKEAKTRAVKHFKEKG